MGDASVQVNFDAIAVLRRWPSLGGGSMTAGISAMPILRPSKQHRPSEHLHSVRNVLTQVHCRRSGLAREKFRTARFFLSPRR
jgi:hypothetical protein